MLPFVLGLGGCGAFWVHKRDTDSNTLFDAMCTSPTIADQNFTIPAWTVGVPGIVAGLKSLHDSYGYLRWADLFLPAIDLAQNGFDVSLL